MHGCKVCTIESKLVFQLSATSEVDQHSQLKFIIALL